MNYIPRLSSGQTIPPEAWNALADAVESLLSATGTSFGDVGIAQGSGGLQVLDGRTNDIYIRLTNQTPGTANYAFVSVYPLGNGTWGNQPQDENSVWGNLTVGPVAREWNGRTDVPIDGSAVVKASIDEVGNGLLFVYGSSGVGASWVKTVNANLTANIAYEARTSTFYASNQAWVDGNAVVYARGGNAEGLANGERYLGCLAADNGNASLGNNPVYVVTARGGNNTFGNGSGFLGQVTASGNSTFLGCATAQTIGAGNAVVAISPPTTIRFPNSPANTTFPVGQRLAFVTIPGNVSNTTANVPIPACPADSANHGWVSSTTQDMRGTKNFILSTSSTGGGQITPTVVANSSIVINTTGSFSGLYINPNPGNSSIYDVQLTSSALIFNGNQTAGLTRTSDGSLQAGVYQLGNRRFILTSSDPGNQARYSIVRSLSILDGIDSSFSVMRGNGTPATMTISGGIITSIV